MKKVVFILTLFPFIVNAQINTCMKISLLNKDKEFLLEIKAQDLKLDSNNIIIDEQFINEFSCHLDTTSTINGIISFEVNSEIVYVYIIAVNCSWIPTEYPYSYNFKDNNIYKVNFDSAKVRENYLRILFNY